MANLVKKIFKAIGICAAVFLSLCAFYELWFYACSMIAEDNYLFKIDGFFILLCESAMAVFVMIIIIAFIKMKWLGKEDEDDKEDF